MRKHLYDSIANRWLKNNGTVWVISDPHFNDAESQGYRHTYPGDNELVKKINSKVGKNDTLVILGDVGDIEFVKKLKGYKVLIMGNHDKGASNYKRVIEHVTKCPRCGSAELNSLGNNDGFSLYKTQCNVCGFKGDTFGPDFDCVEDNHLFDEVYEGPLMINDRVILSHEPIEVPDYMFNIHGHTHGLPHKYDDRHLNMCAEAIDYTPVNMLNLIKDGLLKDTKSIHQLTVAEATKRKIKRNIKNVDKMLEELK